MNKIYKISKETFGRYKKCCYSYLNLLKVWAFEYSTITAILVMCCTLVLSIFILPLFLVFEFDSSRLVLAIYAYGYVGIPVNGTAVYEVAGRVTNLYSWFLPLSITFYYFIAREQKTLSESSLNLDSKGLRHFFLALIGLSGSGVVICFLHTELKLDYVPSVLFLLVAYLAFLFGVFRFISYFTRSININYLFFRILSRTRFSINALFFKQNTCYLFRKKLYGNLRYLIESVYQLLNQSIIKGLLNVYRSNYREWKEIIDLIFSVDKGRKDIELIYKNIRQYPVMYKTILSNQAALITSLYSSNKLAEGYEALSDLFILLPDGYILSGEIADAKVRMIRSEYSSLMQEYLRILCSLGLFFYRSNIILYPLILQIQGLPMQRIGIDKIISIYRTWIIKTVESCDVKMLVCLSYALMETVEKATISSAEEDSIIKFVESTEFEDNTKDIEGIEDTDIACSVPIKEIDFYISKALNMQLTEVVPSLPEEKISISDSDKGIGKCIYVLLNAAIKSLEMSQYQCVGFVVKFIVSNFRSEITNPTFQQFITNKGRDNKFDTCEIGGSFGLNSFNLNNKTDQYCLEKLLFLLYGQQVYIKTKNISIRHIPTEYINIQDYIGNNIKYIYDKIIAGKDKYGMVWLNDEKFHKRLFYSISNEQKW